MPFDGLILMLPKLLTLRMTYQVISIGSVLTPPRCLVPMSGRVSSETGVGMLVTCHTLVKS